MLTLTQLKNTTKVDFEDFNNTLLRYGKVLADFINDEDNERERYFEYKGNYFRSLMQGGEVIAVGYEGDILTPLLEVFIDAAKNNIKL